MAFKIKHKLDYHLGSVNTAIYDTTGNYVITGGQDKTIKLINANNARLIQSYKGHGWPIQGLSISTDNKTLVSCGGDRSLTLWDIESGGIIKKYSSGHKHRVDCVAQNYDASILVSGSFDKTVAIWDNRSNQRTPLQVLDDAKDGISSVSITGTEIIAGSIDGCVRTYDIRTGTMMADTLGQPVVSTRLSTYKQSDCLVVACMDSTVQLIGKLDGKVVGTFSGHQCKQYRIQCDSNTKYIASGSEDGFVYLWDIVSDSESGRFMTRLSGHSGVVNGVVFHPQSASDVTKENNMISTASDGSVIIWE